MINMLDWSSRPKILLKMKSKKKVFIKSSVQESYTRTEALNVLINSGMTKVCTTMLQDMNSRCEGSQYSHVRLFQALPVLKSAFCTLLLQMNILTHTENNIWCTCQGGVGQRVQQGCEEIDYSIIQFRRSHERELFKKIIKTHSI